MTLKLYFALSLLFICLSTSYAQPKREFRGVWIANVANVDWPSTKILSPEKQREELISLLDLHQRQGLNAIFFQVRNTCDAVYQSNIEPWSEWLMGQQGLSPDYDPLAFAIQECRKRNMEIHAWINPYRAVLDATRSSISPNHITKTRPDWILSYGNLRLLDPGNPEVREYVLKIVLDIAKRYDVDGIHFDDYFYPYPQAGLTLNDNVSFNKYDRGFTDRADWRRDNVDLLVKTVIDSLKSAKPWIKFGISPFGIWQNKGSSTLGSNTKGFESYSGNYSDSKKWIEQNWIDYIVPQVYWSIGNPAADFAALLPWWNSNANGRHLYVGHGLYKVNNDADVNWKNKQEIIDQIEMVRASSNTKGSAFFSSKTLRNNPLGTSDLIAKSYNRPALIPVMPWKDNTPPAPATDLKISQINTSKTVLNWKYTQKSNSEFDRVRAFVVYRFENNRLDLTSSSAILSIVPYLSSGQILSFEDTDLMPNTSYSYAVTALDRFQNESESIIINQANPITSVAEIKQEKTAPVVQEAPTIGVLQIFPNPFSQQVSIRFSLENPTEVQLFVFDSKGARVGVLIDGQRTEAGQHSVVFNGEFLSEGTYFARLMTKGSVQTAKIILAK